jgi:hypothetical protein
MTRRHTMAALLLTLVGLFTIVSPLLADYNATHLFNPRWTPHARFHGAHTMSMGILLGAATLFFTWRRRGERWRSLAIATGFGSIYWVAQLMATQFPTVGLMDPEFDLPSSYLLGIPINIFANVIVLALLAIVGAVIASAANAGAREVGTFRPSGQR